MTIAVAVPDRGSAKHPLTRNQPADSTWFVHRPARLSSAQLSGFVRFPDIVSGFVRRWDSYRLLVAKLDCAAILIKRIAREASGCEPATEAAAFEHYFLLNI